MNAMPPRHKEERRHIAFVDNKRGFRFRLNKGVSLPVGTVVARLPAFPHPGLATLESVDKAGRVLETKRMQGQWLVEEGTAKAILDAWKAQQEPKPLPEGEIVLDTQGIP